jgi:enamine deaminase RidA (YjgF/YER057c/UK114 family)
MNKAEIRNITQVTCLVLAAINTVLYAATGDSDYYISLNIFVAASFIIGALEK